MSKPDPIFSKADAPSNLPTELAGKSAEEVAAYYQRREQLNENRWRQQRQPPPSPPREEPREDKKFDMFGDPEGSVRRVVDTRVNEEINRVQQIAQPALRESCRAACAAAHADYPKFAAEIERRMYNEINPEGQMNPQFWEMTYRMVKGENADRMAAEAEERGRRSMMPVERPTPAGEAVAAPRDLEPEERVYAKRFEMTEDEWRAAADRFNNTNGALPMTMDTRRRSKPKEKTNG